MDAPRAAVRLSAIVALAAAALLVVLSAMDAPARASPVLAQDGSPFAVPGEAGVHKATWNGKPVIVVVTTQARLDAVDVLRGKGSATPHEDLRGGLAIFALSAKSTHLGCTVGFVTSLGASTDVADYDGDGMNDGRIMDPCHQAQWDAYHRGRLQRGPAGGDLPVLDLQLRDGLLYATGFDPPVGT